MNVKSQNAQLFYFFTVPLGVLLYYVMIHLVATKLANILNNAMMMIWRRGDDPMSDKQRDLFERVKLSLAVFTLTLIFIACLASISFIEGRPYIAELVEIIDILYTITSSENFIFYELNHDISNAVLSAFIYFFLILSAYTTTYTIVMIFTHHKTRDVFGFIFGEWAYRCFSTDDEEENEKNIWDDYRPVPMRETKKKSLVPIQSNTKWLHNDGDYGMDFSLIRHTPNGGVAEQEEDERYVTTPTKR